MDEPRREGGFTLIEVVVVVALLGLITSVIAATVTVVIRNEGPANERALTANAQRGLQTWLSYDVVGVATPGFDVSPGSTSGCTGASPGSNLVRLTWTSSTGGTTTHVASYRLVDGGVGKAVRRYRCSGTGAGPYGNVTSLDIASDLGMATPTVTPIIVAGNTVGVSIEAITISGGTIRAGASSRNTPATLPPPPTTTTVAPPAPCTVQTTNLPTSAANESSGSTPSRLAAPVTLTFVLGGACYPSMSLTYDRGDGAGPQTDAMTGTFPNLSVTLPRSFGEQWTDGVKTMTVMNGPTALTPTYGFTVT